MSLSINFNLSKRITLGYMIIITISLLTAACSIFLLQRNKDIDAEIQLAYLPVYLKLKDLESFNKESQTLANHWIYQPTIPEKTDLNELHDREYPALKSAVDQLLMTSSIPDSSAIRNVLALSDAILDAQQKMMSLLAADSLYANDAVVDQAILLLEKEITPGFIRTDSMLSSILDRLQQRMNDLQLKKEKADTFLSGLLVCMITVFCAIFLLSYLYAKKSIVEPIVRAKDLMVSLAQGKLIDIHPGKRNDEIGEMLLAMNCLTTGMNSKSRFAQNIGKGNYHDEFELLGPADVMGTALLDMRNQLKKRNRELDRFVYSASHDLRAPIASVKGLINLIRIDPSEEHLRHCLALIERSMDRLDAVIHEMMDFFQNARSDLKEENVDLYQLVRSEIGRFTDDPSFDQFSFIIHCRFDHIVVQTDGGRLKMILNNLLSNAVQFRDTDRLLEVKIHIDIRDSQLYLAVEDNGAGIQQKFQHRIFEMFFRGHDRSGSGLGLYIVKEVVTSLSGSIDFESSDGKETRFYIFIPVKTFECSPEEVPFMNAQISLPGNTA